MIPVDDKSLTVEGGGAAFAVAVFGVHVSEIFFPKNLPLEIHAIEAVGTKEGKDLLAVGDRGCRGVGSGEVMAFVRHLIPHRGLP